MGGAAPTPFEYSILMALPEIIPILLIGSALGCLSIFIWWGYSIWSSRSK
jgi:hypothetical protein